MTNKTTATKAHRFIDLTPTPNGMAKIIFTLARDGDNNGKATALAEIAKAFRIAYAYWYPEKPEYKIDGLNVNKNVRS